MAGKFSGILLCSDFDGTLTADGRTVSRENLEAIDRFESEGGLFTMASGRFADHFDSIEGLHLNTFAIALNGNVIYDQKARRTVWTNPIPPETLERIMRFTAEKCPESRGLHINSIFNGTVLRPEEYPDGIDALLDKISSDPTLHPVMKVIVRQTPQISPELRAHFEAAFPELMFAQSWPEGLEMNTLTGGKGNAVRKLRELLGGREVIHTVVCVGDYENDLSMIEYADIGYAVANAIQPVKDAADRVTVSNREHALARIINDLEH